MRFGTKSAAMLAAATLAIAAAPAAAVPADLRERVDALLEQAIPADGPGVAVIVTDDGETVYAGGRGLADVEAGRPVTPRTVFRLGSITKQFTAAAILQLVDEGRLSLDDPISRFFPDFPEPGAHATVAQLLSHISGIQSYTAIPGWMAGDNPAREHSTAEMIATFRELPSPSHPGERWSYNNSGYVLLGAIIEQVTGMPWHQAVAERIARPLGLATLRYGVDGEPALAEMARGYSRGPDGIRAARPIHMSVPHAAGGLIGSVEDLARWAAALHYGRVVGEASYARMTAPTTLPDGSTVPYGFGLFNAEVRGRRAIEHGGDIFGFSTESIYFPEEDLFVAVFANTDRPPADLAVALRRIAALAHDDPYPEFRPVPVDAAALEPFFGVYTLPEGAGERRFYARDGKLYTQRTGASELEVFAAGDNRFFYGPDSLTWFALARGEDGAARMEMHQSGENAAEVSARAGPIPPEPAAFAVPRATLQSYVGRYSAPPGPVTIAFADGDTLTVQLGNQPALPLRATSPTEFAIRGVDARLVFHVENGAVARLVVHQGDRELVAPRAE